MKKQGNVKLPKIVVVCGPTATGKSDLAVELAKKFNGEIISADSRQVYRGMNIGSGKITKKEMSGIPHHLLDISSPKKIYNAEQFKIDGTKIIKEIISRGKLPIICGGTGFYIDALVSNEQFPDVPPNPVLRKKLSKKSADSLMKIITKLDPRRAKALDPYNKVRIIRAIEIARVLGSVPKVKKTKKYNALYIGLNTAKEKLHNRIHIRLEKRMQSGMVREVSKLQKNGVSWKRLNSFGLEYRYLALYLQKKLTKKDMLTKLEHEIIQYSRRQMQWFKRNAGIKWFDLGKNRAVIAETNSFLSS